MKKTNSHMNLSATNIHPTTQENAATCAFISYWRIQHAAKVLNLQLELATTVCALKGRERDGKLVSQSPRRNGEKRYSR